MVADVLRSKFTSLDAEIQLRATQAELTQGLAVAVSDAVNLASNNVLPQTSDNSNSVGTLSTLAAANYDPWRMQAVKFLVLGSWLLVLSCRWMCPDLLLIAD